MFPFRAPAVGSSPQLRTGRSALSRRRIVCWILLVALSTGAGLWARGEIDRRVARWSFTPAASLPRAGGTLVIAGGGRLPDSIKRRFLELAGGTTARIVIIPAADLDESDQRQYSAEWKVLGPESVSVLHSDSRSTSEQPEFSRSLDAATGVWLGGGQQTWLAAWYRNTPVQERLQALLARGGVIGGTSAGASAMSDPMIAGGRMTPYAGRGLGLAPGLIIDQHFIRRNRMSRLMKMLEDHPNLVGLGIDEGTAVVLSVKSGRFQVIGDSSAVALCLPDGTASRPRIEFFHAGGDFTVAGLKDGTPVPPTYGFDLADVLGE